MKIHVSKNEELAYDIRSARIQIRRHVKVEIAECNILKANANISNMLRHWKTVKEKEKKSMRKI